MTACNWGISKRESALSPTAADKAAASELRPRTQGAAANSFPSTSLPPLTVATAADAPATPASAALSFSSCGISEGRERHVRTTGRWLQDGGAQPNNLQPGTEAGLKPGPHDSINAVLRKRSLPYAYPHKFEPDAKFMADLERAIGAV
jgi:hypothetical protein